MSPTKTKQLQRALRDKGFYHGKIDGDWGPLTDRAVIDFKRSIGYRPRPYVGPLTWAALMEDRNAAPVLVSGEPSWLRVARTYLGLREYRGRSHNKTILKWWRDIGLGGIQDDETAWCSAAVGGVMVEAGYPSTRSGAARSWNNYGRELSRPAVGSVVVFWRGSRSGWKGHVAFVVGQDQHGNLMCAGGNQGDAFNIKPFSKSRVLSYRWPVNAPEKPNYRLPIVNSNGQVSTNEA